MEARGIIISVEMNLSLCLLPPARHQSFTIPGSANFYHSSPEPLAGGLVAQSDVSLSNGKSLSVIVGVPSDDPYAK